MHVKMMLFMVIMMMMTLLLLMIMMMIMVMKSEGVFTALQNYRYHTRIDRTFL